MAAPARAAFNPAAPSKECFNDIDMTSPFIICGARIGQAKTQAWRGGIAR
jgi:hypothetical protein